MSYAMLKNALDTKGLWSVARGLARNEAEYKRHLAACDQPRRGDRDGRGTLSEAALAEFTAFFLKICIDQIKFMEGLMKPDRLRDRILIWAEEEMRAGTLAAKSDTVLRGVSPKGRAVRVVHRGPYATMSASYEKLAAYMAVHGLKEGRVSWEHYISDPTTTAEDELLTHIYFLVDESE